MSELERALADQIARGEITTEDAASVHVFAQFLAETPKGVTKALRVGPDAVVRCFPDRDSFKAWRTRWLAYTAGLADGPTEPDEYAELFPPKESG
jgi:hypothetical protein